MLVFFEQLTGNISIAIVIMTLLVRIVLIPLFRRQTVSQKRMQLLAPELKEIQRRYKGDRVKVQQATAEFYKERGVNPASGCLPLILQFVLLIPMYTVFRDGLQNFDPNAMLNVFGVQLITLDARRYRSASAAGAGDPVHQLHGLRDRPEPAERPVHDADHRDRDLGPGAHLGPAPARPVADGAAAGRRRSSDDQNTRIQRQTMLFVPLISIFYGGFLPAGLFIYWIVSTIFSIVQQYLILGWGGMFPIFGWTRPSPGTTPRASRSPSRRPIPTKRAPHLGAHRTPTSEPPRAASTVRPRERSGRKGRRGRRR